MTLEEIIAELRVRGTQSVPFTGKALGDLQRGASYQAAKDGTLGVDVFWSGGKLRAASLAIARKLGVEDKVVAAKSDPQIETAPLAVAVPASQPATPNPASSTARKAVAPKASTARKASASKARAARPARRQSAQAVG